MRRAARCILEFVMAIKVDARVEKMVGSALTDLAIFDTGECGSEWIGARMQARGADIIDWRATADASGPAESSIVMVLLLSPSSPAVVCL